MDPLGSFINDVVEKTEIFGPPSPFVIKFPYIFFMEVSLVVRHPPPCTLDVIHEWSHIILV